MINFRFKPKIIIKPKAIKTLSEAQKKAIHITAEQLLHEKVQQQQIPFDEGTLQNVQTYVETKNLKNGEANIVHDTPYARRLYYHPEYKFQTTHNKNARGEWWEDYITGKNKDRPKEIYKQAYKYLTGKYVE